MTIERGTDQWSELKMIGFDPGSEKDMIYSQISQKCSKMPKYGINKPENLPFLFNDLLFWKYEMEIWGFDKSSGMLPFSEPPVLTTTEPTTAKFPASTILIKIV